MKIAIVDTSGSLTQFIEPLLNGMIVNNHDPVIIGDSYQKCAIKFYRFAFLKKFLPARLVYVIFRVFFVCQFLKKEQIDIVNIHWVEVPLIWYIWCSFFKLKVVFTIHNSNPGHGIKNFRNLIANLGRKKLLKYSARNIVLSEYGKGIIEKEVLARCSYIQHGLIHKREQKFSIFENNKPTVLCLGIISEYKKVDEVIREFINFSGGACNLLIAGRIRDPQVQKLLEEHGHLSNIKVLDRFLSENEFHGFIYSADILILNHSEIDSSGLLFSALDSDIVIAARNLGGFSEFLTHNENAFLYENVSELFTSIDNGFFCSHKINQLVSGKHKLRDSWPDWTKIAKSYEAVFTDAIK